jgi:hypothetical protein
MAYRCVPCKCRIKLEDPINQPINQSIVHSIQRTNQSINQSINVVTSDNVSDIFHCPHRATFGHSKRFGGCFVSDILFSLPISVTTTTYDCFSTGISPCAFTCLWPCWLGTLAERTRWWAASWIRWFLWTCHLAVAAVSAFPILLWHRIICLHPTLIPFSSIVSDHRRKLQLLQAAILQFALVRTASSYALAILWSDETYGSSNVSYQCYEIE